MLARPPLGRKSLVPRSKLANATRRKRPPAELAQLKLAYERARAEEIRDAAQAKLDEIAAAGGSDD